MLIIHRIPRLLLFLIFPTIYFGWHVKFRRYVKVVQGKSFKVEYGRSAYLQMDGESLDDVTIMEITR
jgi:diacylglycerol kinase family enzyme